MCTKTRGLILYQGSGLMLGLKTYIECKYFLPQLMGFRLESKRMQLQYMNLISKELGLDLSYKLFETHDSVTVFHLFRSI